MTPKKNPKTDLNNNRGFYFQIGLILVLLMTYFVLEWKSYDQSGIYIGSINISQPKVDVIPIIEIQTPPPAAPQPKTIEKIEVIDNDLNQQEVIPISTESTTEIPKIADIPVKKDEIDLVVPFITVEDVPLFPGCELVAKDQRRVCFQEKMNEHIRKNFEYPEIAREMNVQGKVYVQFTIAKDGSITDVMMRGPDKNLEKEAARIISKLPKMTPGKQRGNPVKVPFSIPINFVLQ
ncbi:MAG: energy transducer TonB [Flavobacteriaceae bacterium]|nr:energy transducer TonB [Flavobacteriaceae bacterium]MDZ4146903.1 energy transducer TonB [Flavobacteriaceae bacterium]